jgi:hypothetical protein
VLAQGAALIKPRSAGIHNKMRKNQMPVTALKPKAYPGVQLLAAASIEANSVEQALRGAQFRFDRALHDLRSEFIVRENKLRDEYLAEVAEITGGSGD